MIQNFDDIILLLCGTRIQNFCLYKKKRKMVKGWVLKSVHQALKFPRVVWRKATRKKLSPAIKINILRTSLSYHHY